MKALNFLPERVVLSNGPERRPKYLQRFLFRQKKEDARQEPRNLQGPFEGR